MLIASLFVEIEARGMAQTAAAVRNIGNAMSQVNTIRAAGTRFQRQADEVERRSVGTLQGLSQLRRQHVREMRALQYALGPVNTAFTMLAGGVTGFVAAGLRGTTEGAALTLRFQILSREIAGVFLPVVYKIIDAVESVIGWFKGLDKSQQDFIMNLTLGAIAGLGVAKVLGGPLLGAINAAIGGIQLLTAAGLELNVVTAGIPILIGAIVTAVGALAVGTETGRSVVKQLWEGLKKLWEMTEPIREQIAGLARQVGSLLVQSFQDFINALRSLFGLDTKTFWQFMVDGIKGCIDVTVALIKQLRIMLMILQNPGVSFADAAKAVELDDKIARARARLESQEGRRAVTLQGGGFEAIAQTWNRIQSAANKTDFDKQTATNTKQAADLLFEMNERERARDQRGTPPMGMT
jgi:hypothetical protein